MFNATFKKVKGFFGLELFS